MKIIVGNQDAPPVLIIENVKTNPKASPIMIRQTSPTFLFLKFTRLTSKNEKYNA